MSEETKPDGAAGRKPVHLDDVLKRVPTKTVAVSGHVPYVLPEENVCPGRPLTWNGLVRLPDPHLGHVACTDTPEPGMIVIAARVQRPPAGHAEQVPFGPAAVIEELPGPGAVPDGPGNWVPVEPKWGLRGAFTLYRVKPGVDPWFVADKINARRRRFYLPPLEVQQKLGRALATALLLHDNRVRAEGLRLELFRSTAEEAAKLGVSLKEVIDKHGLDLARFYGPRPETTETEDEQTVGAGDPPPGQGG